LSELRKEERIFLELGKRRGALPESTLARAHEKARVESISVVEALVATNGLSLEDADAIRKELMALSFTCPSCEGIDFRELDEPKVKGRRCSDCLGKAGPPPDTANANMARTRSSPPSGERPAADDADLTQAMTRTAEGAPRAGSEDVTAGTVLGGCRIVERIGQGGMGRVYKGHHDGLDRDMAVKLIDPALAAKKTFVDQFLGEARTLAKLDHPNIVRVFNVETDANGRHLIVMELLEGGSVESFWREKGRKLELADAVRIVREAAEGLLHAHQAGLIHRDVKPGNLMLTLDRRVKVVDFGLAARTEGDVFIATEVAGTPHYMAPEQVDGLRLDGRCDQYSLGATFFQLLCGRPVFEASRSFEILISHVNKPPPRPSELRKDLPEWVDAVVAKMLAKTPGERFPSLADVVQALDRKDAKNTPLAAPAKAIEAAEILKLSAGSKPLPIPPPSWRNTLLTMAASIAAAVLFILVPAHEAFGGANLGLGDVPGIVRQLEKTTRARVASGRPEDYQDALASLGQTIDDLQALPGAATLGRLRASILEERKVLAAQTEQSLAKRMSDLLAGRRFGAALDLADPTSSTLIALDLQGKARAWAEEAQQGLAKRREVYIPPGAFRTGEGTRQLVLPGFYLDVTEVTNEAWSQVMEKAGLDRPPSWPEGPIPAAIAKKPVVDVTFEQASRFAKALGKRLPTSMEWEKAARGLDARAWPWGSRFERGRANLLDGGSGSLEDVDARPRDRSPWGALGMAGNAMEWVLGPEGPEAAGGAFRSQAATARVFARYRVSGKNPAIGFRCARDLE
jgi:formylglycine-generating enzyme required for sulfatase activity